MGDHYRDYVQDRLNKIAIERDALRAELADENGVSEGRKRVIERLQTELNAMTRARDEWRDRAMKVNIFPAGANVVSDQHGKLWQQVKVATAQSESDYDFRSRILYGLNVASGVDLDQIGARLGLKRS